MGHHSERGHRNALKRIDNRMRKASERDKDAKRLAGRAAGLGKSGVSSDDPEAVRKLKENLAGMEAERVRMKATNAAWRKVGKPQVGPEHVDGWRKFKETSGMGDKEFVALLRRIELMPYETRPFPSYSLTNLGANIRRVHQRIDTLKAAAEAPEREPIEGDGWCIFEDRDENRTCVEFDERIPKEHARHVKSCGFRWNRRLGCWTRLMNLGAWYAAERAVKFTA